MADSHKMITLKGCIRTLLVCVVFCMSLAALNSSPARAAIEAVQFDNPADMERYQYIISELRCLVCQNQTLADSDADLAKDLRRKTEEMINAGKTDQQILAYMRDRYGDFVLYRPPLGFSTALIWIGPFVLLLIAATALLINIKRRGREQASRPVDAAGEARRAEARNILANTPDLNLHDDDAKK